MNKYTFIDKSVSAILITIIIFVGLLPFSLTTVKTYQEGVRINLGKIKDKTTGDGLAYRFPFLMKVKKIDMRERVAKLQTTTVSKEGLKFGVNITVRYQVKPGQAVTLVKELQTPLHDLVGIYTNATIDDVATGKDKEEMYSDVGRTDIVKAVKSKLNEELSTYAIINQVVFEDITLPDTITNAIAEQQAELEKIKKAENAKQVAEKEAEIRIIEAQGIAEANRIIQRSLTREYLQYEAIQKFNPEAEKIYIPHNALVPTIDY